MSALAGNGARGGVRPEVAIRPYVAGLQASNARTGWRSRRGWWVEIRLPALDRDVWGIGEVAPLPAYSPETTERAGSALVAYAESPGCFDPQRPAIEQIVAILGTIGEDVPSVRCGVETAWLDLAGKLAGRPVWSLLGAESPAPVALAALVGAVAGEQNPEDVITAARAARARGIGTFKVKVGRPGELETELRLLDGLRRALGQGVVLRLDANGMLPEDSAARVLDRLATARPVVIEEPVAREALLALEHPPIPVAVDETLQHPDGWPIAETLIRRGDCPAIVLKPMALGGVLACLALARRAHRWGAGAIVSHLFDGPVARAAAAHLALALPAPWAAGLAFPRAQRRMWHDAPFARPAVLAEAEVTPAEEPGLGGVGSW